MALDDNDKQILDEVAEATAYLYQSLIHQRPGFTPDQAGKMTAHAVPGILQARLGVIRRS